MDRLRTLTVFGRPAALVLGALVFLAAGGLSLSDNLRTGAGPIRPSEELTGLLLELGLPPFVLQDFLLGINAATVCVVFGLFLLLTYCVLTCRPWARTGAMALVLCSAVSAITAHSGTQLFFALVAAAGVFLLLTRHAGAWLRERQPGWRRGTLPQSPGDATGSGSGGEASDQGAGSGSRFFDLVAEEVTEDDGDVEKDTGREKDPAAASPVPAATVPTTGPAAGSVTVPASRRMSGRGRPGRAARGTGRLEQSGPDQPAPGLPAADGAGAAPGPSAGSGRGRGRKRKAGGTSGAGRGPLPAPSPAAAAAETSPAEDPPSLRPAAESSGSPSAGSTEDAGGGGAAALVGADAGPSTQRAKFRGRVKGFLEGRGR